MSVSVNFICIHHFLTRMFAAPLRRGMCYTLLSLDSVAVVTFTTTPHCGHAKQECCGHLSELDIARTP